MRNKQGVIGQLQLQHSDTGSLFTCNQATGMLLREGQKLVINRVG